MNKAEITRLKGLVNYYKVTAEKRLAAIKHVQEGHVTGGFRSVNDFCRWLDHGDEWMGLTIKGKMDWAKKILQQIGLPNEYNA